VALVAALLTACGGKADREPPALSGVVALSAGFDRSCALLEDGSVNCWGATFAMGKADRLPNPPWAVTVPGIEGAMNVSVGWTHACAALQDGSVECWGDLPWRSSLRGDSTTPIDGLTEVRAVVSASDNSCALRTDGTARCWGTNSDGQLGADESFGGFSSEPVTVANLNEATALALNSSTSCALLADGRVKCWGSVWGQADDAAADEAGEHRPRIRHIGTPELVDGLENATSLSIGFFFSCATLADTTVACWGVNAGESIADRSATISATPVAVPGLIGVSAISAGHDHVCALLNDGTLRCWGENIAGQLGDGSKTSSSVPVPVSGIDSAIAVAAGVSGTCALLRDRTVRCWGSSALGCFGFDCGSLVPVAIHTQP